MEQFEKIHDKIAEQISGLIQEAEYWGRISTPEKSFKGNVKTTIEKIEAVRLTLLNIIEVVSIFAPVGNVAFELLTALNSSTYEKICELKNVLNNE